MKITNKFFINIYQQRGGMLVELLLTLALSAIMLPFIFSFQQGRIENTKNTALNTQMEYVKNALEKYMDKNKSKLLSTIGKNITRVNISDLEDYGLPNKIIESGSDKFQVRILKTNDKNSMASLQGIVIRTASDISPLRTRQIANIGGNKMGFIDNGNAFGAFGTWRTNTLEMGINNKNGLIKTTDKKRATNKYLHRLPTQKISDATMLSKLNMGNHNINNVKYLNSDLARLDEKLSSTEIIADTVIFNNRTTINDVFKTSNAVVSGNLSSDFKNIEVSNTLTLSDTAKFSKFETDNLWVMDLNLSGLSVSDSDKINILKINQISDITSGNINAINTTVGYTGSITPKLIVTDLITDSSNQNYYWNLKDNTAQLSDATLMELNSMAGEIIKSDKNNTVSYNLFSTVSTNNNATVTDFINVINEIKNKVQIKYNNLNLE